MKIVAAGAAETLEKRQPESCLSNLLAEILWLTAKEKCQQPIDAAFLYYCGILLPSLAAGNIIWGKVF